MANKTVDLRTYLLLERAFVRRLQRAWKKISAPTYTAITQACLDHKWDEARRLVSDLDMAEVGTENREWITYMLLSCAVFGANTVSKKKPSFVGVGTFDTFLKQTTNNMLQYLEYNATQQVQREALQLIATDEVEVKALKFDPNQLRDEQGRWAKGGKAGGLTTDLGNTFLHGTAQGFLDDILRNGIRGEHGGRIHPTDRRGRTLALPGHVYMTTDLEEAKEYAQSAGLSDEFFIKHKETVLNPVYAKGYPRIPEYDPHYESGTEIGGGLPCVITVELPPHVVKKLRKDRRSDILTPSPYAEGGGKRVLSDYARSYKGDIKPEWIKSISYATRDLAKAHEFTWHTINAKEWKPPGPTTPPYLPAPPDWEVSPEWEDFLEWKSKSKVAAEGTVLYIALKIPVQSVAEKPEGIGGITRKFDATKHPRGEDGRFIEATAPRIFNRPSEIMKDVSWGETSWRWIDKETGKASGHLLTGEPVQRENLPETLYHVTTNAPAVESSGVLLGLLESGGLGGGQALGVSFTTSREDATVIQRELRRAIQIARGELDIDALERWAEEDAKEVGLPKEALANAVGYARDFWEGNIHSLKGSWVSDPTGEYADENRGKTFGHIGVLAPEEKERLRRSLMKDTLNAYLQLRGHVEEAGGQRMALLKNPILFSDQNLLATLDPKNVQTLEVPSAQIPEGALVTTGSDKFLHEVRAYSDVPMRRRVQSIAKFDESKHPRYPEGVSEGGQFKETGRTGVATPDPALAKQAETGIATVEKLLPEAVKTARYEGVPSGWGNLNVEAREKVRKRFEEQRYDQTSNLLDTQDLDANVKYEIEHKKEAEIAIEAKKRLIDLYQTRPIVTGREDRHLDVSTIRVDDPYPEYLILAALRRTDGTELTPFERSEVAAMWGITRDTIAWEEVKKYQDTDEYLARREQLVLKKVQEEWETTSEHTKYEMALAMRYAGQLSGEMEATAREPKKWVTGVETEGPGEENYARTHVIALRLTELRMDQLREERGLFKPPTYTIEKGVYDENTGKFLPAPSSGDTFIVRDAVGNLVWTADTMEHATAGAERWAKEQVETQRDVNSSAQVIQEVWTAWKQKSSQGLGLSLQLAAARELGGHHRMTPDEVTSAEETAEHVGGMDTLQAYVRAQWEVTQLVMKKAGENKVQVYRGIILPQETVDNTTNIIMKPSGEPIPPPTNVKVLKDTYTGGSPMPNPHPWAMRETVAFEFDKHTLEVQKRREPEPPSWEKVDDATKKQIRDLWETRVKEVASEHLDDPAMYSHEKGMKLWDKMSESGKYQYLMDSRRAGDIPPAPFESTEKAIQRRLSEYFITAQDESILRQLPDLTLQRAGAQSTTGTLNVANNWDGVGGVYFEDPTRVVLRIEAPPTSVLSLPVYGVNVQGEHESVLLGTKDKWLWDAWRETAPAFTKRPIADSARKAESQPTIIDLQAEDRGKPHWMSSVNWAEVQKFDESQHPRDKEGQFTKGHLTSESLTAWAEQIRAQEDLALLDLRLDKNGDIQLETITAKKGQQGRGAGSRAMEALIALADQHQRRIVLSLGEKGYQPIKGGVKTSSPDRLRRFYGRFGFVNNRGRYKDYSLSIYTAMYRKPVQSVAKFDEAKHPRHPEGVSEGGRFKETGRVGEATPDPVLAKQAEVGIAEVEKLLPEAIKTADYEDTPVESWEDVDEATQDETYQKWSENAYDDINVDTSSLDQEMKEELQKDNQKVLDEAVKGMEGFFLADEFGEQRALAIAETPAQEQFQLKKTLDLETLDYGYGDDEDGVVELEWDALRFRSGQALTPDEIDIVKQEWDTKYKEAFESQLQEKLESSEYLDRRSEMENDAINEEWSQMDDSDKFNFMNSYVVRGKIKRRGIEGRAPSTWMTGVEEGEHSDEDYARTHAIALKLTEIRTDQLRKARGLLDPQRKPTYTIEEGIGHTPEHPVYVAKDSTGRVVAASNTKEIATENAEQWAEQEHTKREKISSEKIIGDVWHAWKQKSSDGLGLSLQLAAARELNGHHRMTEDEVDEAEFAAKDYGGMDNLQAYVRAQWEVTQMVMKKAGEDKVQVYRGLMLPGNDVNTTQHTYVDKFGKEIPPPTNIQPVRRVMGGEINPEYITFDFHGQQLQALKKRIPAQSIVDVQPEPQYESDESAVHRRVAEYVENEVRSRNIYVKLPELALKRAGAQSSTGTQSVANGWGGVGNLPPDPTRVVLRIEAPSTSVLSLPVYGQNDQEEHESVIIGTRDKWLWDAWRHEALGFNQVTIAGVPPPTEPLAVHWPTSVDYDTKMALKIESKPPLTIDLQEQDRNKPHWMSYVNWNALKTAQSAEKPMTNDTLQKVQKVAKSLLKKRQPPPYQQILKWDESKVQRNPARTAGGKGGQFKRKDTAGATIGPGDEPWKRRPFTDMGAGNFADIMNAPMGTGFVNRPRGEGVRVAAALARAAQADEAKEAATEAYASESSKLVQSLTTQGVSDHEPMGGGVNLTVKVTLEDGTEAIYKPEAGETWGEGFFNSDISDYITNKDFSLAEREAVAFEVSDALGFDLVPATVLRTNLDVEGLDLTVDENAGMYDSSDLQHMYNEWKEANQDKVFDEVSEEMGRLFSEAQKEHVQDIQNRAEEMADIWNEAVKDFPEDLAYGTPEGLAEHPNLPMGSKTPFERRDLMGELDPLEVLDEANVDVSAPMNSEEKKRVEEIIHKRLKEGYQALGDVDEDAAEQHLSYDDWMEAHQDTEGRIYESKMKSFDSWKKSQGYGSREQGDVKNDDAPHPNGGSLQAFMSNIDSWGSMEPEDEVKLAVLDYVIGTMDRHGGNLMFAGDKPIAIDNGYSMPASDSFTFRSSAVYGWLHRRGGTGVPAAQREPILKALNDTNWQALVDRHPNMNAEEKEAFLGRIEEMTVAMGTDNGLAGLWRNQQLMQ